MSDNNILNPTRKKEQYSAFWNYRYWLYWICFAAVSGFSVSGGKAQIVDIESRRIDPKEEGWQGTLDVGVNFTQNIAQIWQLNNRIGTQYRKNKSTVLFLNDVNLVQFNNSNVVSNGFQHLRYSYSPNKNGKVVMEAFEQVQYDVIQKIKLRVLGGAGARWNIKETDTISLRYGMIPMFEYQEFTPDINTEQIPLIKRVFRMSSYFSVSAKLTKTVGVSAIAYYQPRLNEFSDFRISNESSLHIDLSKKLVFRVIFNANYDSRSLPDIPALMYSVRNSIGLKL